MLEPSCGGDAQGEFCTFGYKYGNNSIFAPAGLDVDGPQLAGGVISYSFHTEIKEVSWHGEDNVETISIDDKGSCVRVDIKRALAEWSMHADIDFEEESDNSLSDIIFLAANIENSNVGYPNFGDELCSKIAGHVIFNANRTNCNVFYLLALHEIGHVLGLGHVGTNNIMRPGVTSSSLEGLQVGDIAGIVSIYGKK